jgi:hypothetical protein
MTEPNRKRVFISYVRDNFPAVDKICKIFSEIGIDFWIDRMSIEPGKFWKDAIKVAINNGAFFLACFSKEYNDRSETYMTMLEGDMDQLSRPRFLKKSGVLCFEWSK